MTNPTPIDLPDNILRCMRPADRKAIGAMTIADAQDAHDTRSERELQRMCEAELSRRGIVYLHLRTKQQAAASPGWPDLTFAVQGIPCAVELKAAHGKLRMDQEATLACMSLNGWATKVIRTFDDFRTFIDNPTQHKDGLKA